MPYGETRVESGQRLDLGYTGHKWDAETKQYFAPYRYYSPANSRWISRDPLGFVDGPNVYGYVGSMPTRYVDPMGLFLGDLARDCINWLFGDDDDDDPVQDQVDNAADTIGDVLEEIITNGKTPGIGISEGKGAAEAAIGANQRNIGRNIAPDSPKSMLDALDNGDPNWMPIPGQNEGKLPPRGPAAPLPSEEGGNSCTKE